MILENNYSNENNENNIIIEWEFYIIKNGERVPKSYKQIIKFEKKIDIPNECPGVIISTLYSTLMLDNNYLKRNELIMKCINRYLNIVNNKQLNVDLSKKIKSLDPIVVLYDYIGCLANATYKIIKKYIKKKIKNFFDNSSNNSSHLIIFDDNDGVNSISDLNNYISKNLQHINNILLTATSIFGKPTSMDEYDDLVRIITEYHDIIGDKKLKEFLKEYLDKNGGRCFALFIDNSDKKYVSLSGFLDSNDMTINCYTGIKTVGVLYDLVSEICKSFNAVHIYLNKNTSTYKISDSYGRIRKGYSVGDLKNSLNNCKQDYSCCERKIFGYFNDNTPSGTLYVKFEMCGRCCMGYLYQIIFSGNYSEIILKDGLMI